MSVQCIVGNRHINVSIILCWTTCKVDDTFSFRKDFLISAGQRLTTSWERHVIVAAQRNSLGAKLRVAESIWHTARVRWGCSGGEFVLHSSLTWTRVMYCWHGDMSDRPKKPKGTACTPRTKIFNYPDATRTQTISSSLFSLDLLKQWQDKKHKKSHVTAY